MPDLDLAEWQFKPHWMVNPVPEADGINEGRNDTRTALSYEDYKALREKGWESVSDVNDSHTNGPDDIDPPPPHDQDPDPEPDPENTNTPEPAPEGGDENEPEPEPEPEPDPEDGDEDEPDPEPNPD